MIVNYGSLNLDLVYHVPHFVQPGETLAAAEFQVFAGGKGANQSMALARAGADVRHAGALGADGCWLKEKLAAANVDVSGIELIDGPSGHAVIQVNEDGENCIILFGGANQTLTPDHAARALAGCVNGDWLLLQNEVCPAAAEAAMAQAAAIGMHIVVNPAPLSDVVLTWPLDQVELLVVNQIEIAQLTGEQEADAAIAACRRRWPETDVLLTLGAEGARYLGNEGEEIAAAEKVKVADTTAAGDTFIGYFLAMWTTGVGLRQSLETACKAAAICVARPGAMDSIPCLDEVRESA